MLAALGVIFRSVMVMSFATIPIVFLAYSVLIREPAFSVEFDRTLSPERPFPGDDVSVELTVTNTGDRTISDLRILDGVPSGLGVAEGTPRSGMLLTPGDSGTLEYTVTARRGSHQFHPVTHIAYNSSGTVVRYEHRELATVLECRRPVEELPLEDAASLLVGREPTDSGGSGVEFYSLREYRPSDERKRIDWRRFAMSGELKTVEYRQHRATSIKLLVDSRQVAFQSVAPEQPPAIEYSIYGAELCFNALLETKHRVGIGFYPTDVTALSIGSGQQHEIEARTLFDNHEALDPLSGPESPGNTASSPGRLLSESHRDSLLPELPIEPTLKQNGPIEELLSELPGYARIIIFTPLLDTEPCEVVNTLQANGFESLVISPNVTDRKSSGGRLSAYHRQIRIRVLRERDVTVVDWNVDDPLSTVLKGMI